MTYSRFFCPEAVPHAAHGLDVTAAERRVDLVSQVLHVLVDDVRATLVGEVPDRIDDLGAGEHRAGMSQEQFQERHLLWGEREFDLASPCALGRRVEPKVPDGEDGRSSTIVTAGEGPDAGRELEETEGLDEIVVSPHVQPTNTVADLVACGEHEDRSPVLRVPQLLTELEAVESRAT